MITLTWTSKEGETYGLFYSTDLADFGSDVDDSVPSQGETTTLTFSNPEPGEPRLLFRVEEN